MLSALSDSSDQRGGTTIERPPEDQEPTGSDRAPASDEYSSESDSGSASRGDKSEPDDDGDEDPGSVDLSLDSIFFALSNSRRRGVIYCLERADGAIEVSRLTTLVAAMENETTPENVTYSERKRVYTSLHQSHLPKMDDLGIVEFDQRASTVEPATGLAEIDVYLDVVPESGLAWSEFYFGIGAFTLTFALLGWASVSPFGLLPGIAYAGVVGVVLMAVSVVHRTRTQTQANESTLDTDVLEELSEE